MLDPAEPFFWQKYRSSILVFGVSISLTLVSVLSFWHQVGFCPNLFFIIFYLWLLYRPDLMSHRQIVVQALLKDCLFLAPLGANLVVNLLLYGSIFGLKKWLLSQPFIMIYGTFIILAGMDQCLYWLIMNFFIPQPFPFRHIALSVALTGFLYPVFNLLSLRWQQRLEN